MKIIKTILLKKKNKQNISYIPPEMVSKKGHGYSMDIYCLGILLYELVAGYPPFSSKSPKSTMELIAKQELLFPEEFSEELKDLLKNLIKREPSKRLGYKEGLNKIFEHPWCKKNLRNNVEGSLNPPIKINFLDDNHFDSLAAFSKTSQFDILFSNCKNQTLFKDFPNFFYKRTNSNYLSLDDIVIREEFSKTPSLLLKLHSVSSHSGDNQTEIWSEADISERVVLRMAIYLHFTFFNN